MPSIRVVIADSSALYRSALRTFLALHVPELLIVGEAQDSSEALACIERAMPDILLLGVDIAWTNGWAVLNHLQQIASPVQVVILSAYDEPAFRQKALDSGAVACLVKYDVSQRLPETIRSLFCTAVGSPASPTR